MSLLDFGVEDAQAAAPNYVAPEAENLGVG